MKYVMLERTAMIGNLPKGPNDGRQLVSNKLASHLVDNGDVLKENVEEADIADPDEPQDTDGIDQKAFDRAVDKAVKVKLKELRAADEQQLKEKVANADKALDDELQRIREEGEASLAQALNEQKAEQDASFDTLVAEAVTEAQAGSGS